MKKIIISALLIAVAGLGASAAMAKGGGGMGNGGHSAANSNGNHSLDRDKGLDRADDRRFRHGKSKSQFRKHSRRVL